MVGLESCHYQGVPTLPTHQTYRKHHRGLDIKGLLHLIWTPHLYFEAHPPTIDRVIIPYKDATQRDYILNIVASSILDMTKAVSKSTAAKNYSNWYQ